jgi:hypothetical protein
MSNYIKLENGISKEYVSNEDYHADREFKSSSVLKTILKNPREYYYKYVLGEEESKPRNMASMNLGSYVHGLILEPELIDEEFAVFSGKVKRGHAWDEFSKQNEGKIIITTSQKRTAEKIFSAFKETSLILGDKEEEIEVSSFYSGGKAEETVTAIIDGMPIKVRFDYRKLESGKFASINDIKTTFENMKWSNKSEIERICKGYMYDLSAALYCDVVEKVTGVKHDFYFTFLSTSDFGVRHVKASEQFLEEGRRKYKEAIRLIKLGDETGVYYSNEIEEIDSV